MPAFGGATVPSGIEAIDMAWQGLQRGGTYLIESAPLKAARLLALRFLGTGLSLNEPGLLISRERPSVLTAHATAAGFDLHNAHEQHQVRVLRLPPQLPTEDDGLAQTLIDLTHLIIRHQPQRVVIDDVLPMFAFRAVTRLTVVLEPLLDTLASLRATLLLTTTPPDCPKHQQLLDCLRLHLTGVLHVEAETITLDTSTHLQPLALEQDSGLFVEESLAPIEAPAESDWASWPESDTELSERDLFCLHLQQCFHQHAVGGTPFQVLALRGDHPAAQSLDFALLGDCACALLGTGERGLLMPDRRRLIVVIERGRSADAQRFFARLKARLLDVVPADADRYLHDITAIVLPNGGSFETAEDLLAATLDED